MFPHHWPSVFRLTRPVCLCVDERYEVPNGGVRLQLEQNSYRTNEEPYTSIAHACLQGYVQPLDELRISAEDTEARQ